ncbi:MAG: hypothetical protein Q4C58_06420 [Eubacteriales bacterium]|nr:hypothetical protein [Eubacteriales bacterium]
MLMILLQWCYVACTAFITGFAVLALLQRKSAYKVQSVSSCMMAGLLAQNVYAQYFSLFAGVGAGANLLMALADCAALFLLRREIGQFLKKKKEETGRGRMLLYGFLVLLFAYGSSRGYMHYDTGLYHAQSIRWIEEYGVVPGLANLHSRFGYNSAAFALCALFGGAGLTREPMHCVQGFFALICAVKCTALLGPGKRNGVRLSDFLYAGCIFYLVAVFRELVAPASDYFAMLLLFFVLMNWVELLERREKEIFPYALLSLCLVYAATVKLSTAVLLVLALQPAVWLIRQKKWKQIAGYIGLGVIIAFPYLARNVLISGWLFYPFTFLDIFPVDWKIPKGYADSDAAEIRVYAKEIYDVYQKDMPFSEWFPNWLSAQTALDKMLVATGWVAVLAGGVLTAAVALRTAWMKAAKIRGKAAAGEEKEVARMERWSFVLLEGAALLGFLFWQFGAPLVRYGYFYVLFLPLVTFGALYVQFLERAGDRSERSVLRRRKRGVILFRAILVAFLLYRGYNLCNMVLEFADQPYYVWQQDYADCPADTYEVDGVTIYVPTDRGQIGYDKFPSSPVVQDIELRGDSLESGFKRKGNDAE